MSTSTVTLSAPLITHNGEVKSITLKEPRMRSFVTHGEPFKVEASTDDAGNARLKFDYNNAILARFLSDMSGIDDGVLSNVSASDYFALRAAATNLIIGVAGTDPTPA